MATTIDPKSKTAETCRNAILHDAKAWARKGPRSFVRKKGSLVHRAALRAENDAIFDAQNADWDASMMTFYEERYARYGGDLDDLPWIKNGKRKDAPEDGSPAA